MKDLSSFVTLDPCPHLVIEDYFSDDILTSLIQECMDYEKKLLDSSVSNKKSSPYSKNFSSGKFMSSESLSDYPALLSTNDYFNSPDFLRQLALALSPYSPARMTINSKVIMDLSQNGQRNSTLKFTPSHVDKVRTRHCDGATSVITFLFYLRLPHDYSTGGNLYLYAKDKKEKLLSKLSTKFCDKLNIHTVGWSKDIYHMTKSIEYKSNTLVAFLNGKDSLHEVSLRKGASTHRIAFQGGITSKDPVF